MRSAKLVRVREGRYSKLSRIAATTKKRTLYKMKAHLSKAATKVLTRLPASVRAVLLRKTIAIAGDRTRFQNWQVTMFGSLTNLREAGFSPGAVVDIGANVGAWTRQAAAIFPEARFHMMEAQPALAADLEQVTAALGDRATFEIGLLGAAAQDAVPFHVLGTGSSVFEEVTDLHKEVVTLPMHRLDDVACVRALPRPLFLKLDVQGYELEVLKGAPELLAEAEAVPTGSVAPALQHRGATDARGRRLHGRTGLCALRYLRPATARFRSGAVSGRHDFRARGQRAEGASPVLYV